MSSIPRPGSMRAAEQKNRRNFLIGAGVVYAFILALFFVIPSYPKDWAARAGGFANVVGTLLVAASYGTMLFFNAVETKIKSTVVTVIVIGLLLVFGVCTLAGFNFDFVGIAQRP